MLRLREDRTMTEDTAKRLEGKIDKMLSIMHGNGEYGCLTKCNMVYDWMVKKISRKEGLITVVYRILLAAAIGHIITKIW